MKRLVLLAGLLLSVQSNAADLGVLIGLRGPNGELRTVLVAESGVAHLTYVHKGEILRPNKEAILRFMVADGELTWGGLSLSVGDDARIGWLSQGSVGLEYDAAQPGAAPFAKITRKVVQPGSARFSTLIIGLGPDGKKVVEEAADEARRKAGASLRARLPQRPDQNDWGYVRNEGHWNFVGTLIAGQDRLEFAIPQPGLSLRPPEEGSDMPWRVVTARHADAIDVVTRKDANFAIVLTPDYLYVYKAGRVTIGKLIRRIPSNSETVVSAFWRGGGPLESWLKFFQK